MALRHVALLPPVLLGLAACSSVRAPQAPAGHASFRQTVPGSEVSFEMVELPSLGLWIGRTEVTWDEYLVFCAFDARRAELRAAGVDAETRPSKPLEVHPFDRHWGTGRRPAVGMSKNGAESYCRWLSAALPGTYRLPTEAEWVAACGAKPSPLGRYAWTAETSGGKTHEVAAKEPDARGLHDMLGNLWEYCADPYSSAEPERAVLRGGSWKDPARRVSPRARLGFDEAWLLDDPNFPPGVWWVPDGDHLGFRMVWTPED